MPRTDKLSTYCTAIKTTSGNTAVVYHSTTIVSFNDKTVTLRSGGYETVTTKRKMNQASAQFGLGYSVYQTNFEWFVRTPRGETLPFVDGMTFQRSAYSDLARPDRRYA